jgi:hypothetical protein
MEIFLNIHYYLSQLFFWFGRNQFWNLKQIFERNIISVELAKVLR